MQSTQEPHLTPYDNPNLQLNPILTVFLTDCTNRLGRKLTKKQKEFIGKAYRINTLGGRPFWFPDFKPFMSDNQYRQHIHNLKPVVEVVVNTNPRQYKLRGLYTNEKLTERYTDLSPEQILFQQLDVLLSLVKHEQVYIHDIKVSCKTSDLYENLVKHGQMPHPQNKMITIPVSCNSSFNTKVNVTKDSIQIHVGCTHNPIEYSGNGILSFVGYLGEVIRELKGLSGMEFLYEPYSNWRFEYFHLNRDSIEYDFPKGYTLHTIFGHACLYKHNMPDGKSKIRLEEKISPDTTILDETLTPRFQKASELI